MTERPIIFSAEMVLAILAGRKTQTRRKMKPAKVKRPKRWLIDDAAVNGLVCPYGAPGDTLWVRETWARHASGVDYAADFAAVSRPQAGPWRPSIHMPRWASRITLRITDVRVERLQDISEDDAVAEGVALERYVPVSDSAGKHGSGEAEPTDPVAEYRDLWNHINGPDAWEANPWVWVISFERVKP